MCRYEATLNRHYGDGRQGDPDGTLSNALETARPDRHALSSTTGDCYEAGADSDGLLHRPDENAWGIELQFSRIRAGSGHYPVLGSDGNCDGPVERYDLRPRPVRRPDLATGRRRQGCSCWLADGQR